MPKDWSNGGVPPALLFIATVVTLVWGVATLVAVVFPTHPVPPSVNAVMGGTVTALFSLVGVLSVRKNGNTPDVKIDIHNETKDGDA